MYSSLELFIVDFLYSGRLHGPALGMPGRTQRDCVTLVDIRGGCPGTDQGWSHVVSCVYVCSPLEELSVLSNVQTSSVGNSFTCNCVQHTRMLLYKRLTLYQPMTANAIIWAFHKNLYGCFNTRRYTLVHGFCFFSYF